MAEVKLDLPADLLKLLQGMGDVEQTIKECIVLELYRRGEISSGKFLFRHQCVLKFWKTITRLDFGKATKVDFFSSEQRLRRGQNGSNCFGIGT